MRCFFFSSRRRHTRFDCDWSSDVCSSDLAMLAMPPPDVIREHREERRLVGMDVEAEPRGVVGRGSLVVSRHAGAPSGRHGPETGEDVAAVALVEDAPPTSGQARTGRPASPPPERPPPRPKAPVPP